MKRWITRPWLWALPALALLTAPVGAQSITCFGSIIVTSLGTEGIVVKVPDGATVTTTGPASDTGIVPDPVSTTINGPGSIDIRPLPPVRTLEPMPNERGDTGTSPGTSTPSGTPTRGGSDAGTAQTGQIDPAVTEVVDPAPIESPPIVTDVPPPAVDDPILTTTVDVPAVPTPLPVDDGNIQTIGDPPSPVVDTPEPATVTLLGLAGVGALLARRKRRPA